MIESIMYFGIGFCAAGLSVLLVVPLVHGRAVRLTKKHLEGAMPSSMAEVLATRDLQRAEFAMSTRHLETKLEELKSTDAGQRAELGRKTDASNRMRMEADGLRDRLHMSETLCAAKVNEAHDLRRITSERESALIELTNTVDTTNQQLVDEQAQFANFRESVATLVRHAAAHVSEERSLSRGAQRDLGQRLIAQAQLLRETERQRDDLRRELETAHKAEHALRATVAELERRNNAAIENFRLENARLQGTLDRANGERARQAYELAGIKRQARDSRAA